MKLLPTSGLIGGEIKGLSLSQTISSASFERLKNFFYERSVITLRDQSIDAKAFLAFEASLTRIFCIVENCSTRDSRKALSFSTIRIFLKASTIMLLHFQPQCTDGKKHSKGFIKRL